MKLNIPNKLILLRFALAFIIFLILLTATISYQLNLNQWGNKKAVQILFLTAGSLFVIASFTDWLDGYLARKNNQVTTFGKIFDPLADKILVNTVLIFFTVGNWVPIWITVIFIVRDIMVDGLRIQLASKKIDVSAGIYGKLKTVFQMFGLTLIFFSFPFLAPFNLGETFPSEYLYLHALVSPLHIGMTLSILSGVQYYISGFQQLKNEEASK